jgi:glycine dehydrogenase subunit 1
MGKEGLKEAAELCLQKSHYAYEKLLGTGKFAKVSDAPFFKEFTVRALNEPVNSINARLLENGIIGGLELERFDPEKKDCWLIAVTEKRTKREIDRFVSIAAGGDQ